MAIILAIAFGTAVNTITTAVMYDAVRSDTPGLSENATQILTTALGGVVGVLGGYIGGRAADSARAQGAEDARVAQLQRSQVDDINAPG